MSTQHMQPNKSFENQVVERSIIKRTMPSKRQSESFVLDPQQAKHRKYEDTENFVSQPAANIIKYVPTRREVDSLVIDNYLFQRVSATTNKDGSVGWRCKEYRRNTKCQSTCRVGHNGEIIRRPGVHNHPHVTDAELVFMKAKADAKKRCRTEDNISVQKIFLQEMGKAIIKSGLKLTAEDLHVLPKFEANKRCLQIQRKLGAGLSKSTSVSENGDDQLSVTSGTEDTNSVSDSEQLQCSESASSESHDDEKECGEVDDLAKCGNDISSIASGLWSGVN